MKKLVSVILCSVIPLLTYAQDFNVEGIVVDKTTGESLPGVNVFVEGTQIGTVTNLDGYYALNVSSGDVTLMYSFIGMKVHKEAVNSRSKIDVALESDSEQLEDVMVVAYGTTTKEAYTGAAQVVDSEIIEDRPVTSFEKSLQGTTAGLQVTSSTGQPGSVAAVRIRGIGSLSASSSPLYVVDGVPMAGSLADLNPNDIESLTVLKDAAASSLYGSRAANGVIMVTTKKGKAGKTSISLNSQMGVSSRVGNGYDLMNSSQFYEQTWQGLYNWGLLYGENEDGSDFTIDDAINHAHEKVQETVGFNPFGVDNPLDDNGKVIPGSKVLTNTNWRDEIYKTGIIQNHNLNVAGGSENTKVYFSLGYFSDSGTTIGSDFSRYTAKLNVQHKVNNWIDAGMSNHLSYSETNAPPSGGEGANPVRSAEIINAASPVYNADGSYNWDNKAVFDFNPVGLFEYDQYNYETKRGLLNAYLNFQLLPSLSFRITGGIDYSNDKGLNYYNPYHGNGSGVNGRSTIASTENMNWNISNIFTWKKQTGDSSIEVIAGQEAMRNQYDVLQAGVTDFSVPFETDLVWGGTAVMPTSYSTANTMVSYLSQAKFNIKSKYNLSASVRGDGSSRFGKNNKFGLFYSLGGGWHLTKEEWMPKVSWLNYAKLRASYGTSGNSSIGNYESFGLYGSGANYSGYPGLSPVQLANQDIRWEKNAALNIGLETTMFNRLDASLEWYTRKSDDLLYAKPLSASKGFGSLTTNLASMKNTGFEATLNYKVVSNSSFSYDIGGNLSMYTNKILDMTTEQIKSGTKIIEEGASLYQFYMREWAGVNPDNGMPMWYTNVLSDDRENGAEPGSSYLDPHGSGRQVTSDYEDAERVRMGLAIPDFFGGLNNNLRYKNLDLGFYFYYSIGGQVYNSDYATNMHDGTDPGYNLAVDASNAWTPNNRYTDVPRYVVNGTDNGNQLSSRFLEDASYLRLKNISIGYNLPQNICQKIKIQGLRIYAMGENIWTLTKYKGFDPEGALNGVTSNSIPGTQVYTFGFKLDL